MDSYWLLGVLILTVTGNSRIQQQNICDAKRPRIPSAWGPHSNSGSFVYVYSFINKCATLAISRWTHAPLQWHWMWNRQDFVVEPNDMLCDNQQLQWRFYCHSGHQRRRMAYDVWPLQEYCRVSRASHSALEWISVGLRCLVLHWSSEQATCTYFECTSHIDTFEQ